MIKIRLARGGRKSKPVYTIVAADSRSPRNGSFLERLGQYDPQNAKAPIHNVKTESVAAWINKGAQMSDTVASLFRKHNIKY